MIDEGEEVTVRRLRFIGNENLTAAELRGVMQTSETGFLSFLGSGNRYKKEVIDEDVNRLQAYYYDFGYLTVEIGEPRVELTPDRQHIDITITIKEGPRFHVGRVKATELNEQARRSNRSPDARRCARASSSTRATGSAARRLPRTSRRSRATTATAATRTRRPIRRPIDQDTRIVDVVVTIRRGPLVHIERINIKGNTKTRDKVLRREVRIVEGQLYSQSRVERSKERMMSLGYFERVEVSEEDGATPDRIVINVEVTERPTGTFQLGAGFSSQETFMLTGQIQQENLFGNGQSLGLKLQFSGIRQLAQIRFFEPYLFDSDWSTAVELFKILQQQISFNRDSTGGNLTLGHPLYFISDDLRIFVNYRLEFVEITPATGGAFGSTGQAFQIFRFCRCATCSAADARAASASRSPTTRATTACSRPGACSSAARPSLRRSDAVADQVHRAPDQRPRLPADLGTVRRQAQRQLGLHHLAQRARRADVRALLPRRHLRHARLPAAELGPRLGSPTSYDDPALLQVPTRGIAIGGNMRFYYNLEIEFPIIEKVGIRGVIFRTQATRGTWSGAVQAGAAVRRRRDRPCAVDFFRWRTSWGFGIRWFSPLGPLRFEWGFPFCRASRTRTRRVPVHGRQRVLKPGPLGDGPETTGIPGAS